MHESSITQSILKIAIEKANENNAKKILKINLNVGELTGFIGDSIQFYFDRYSEGTIAYKAELIISYIKPSFKCIKCSELFNQKDNDYLCPLCGGEGMPTSIGQDFFIENIEIE